MINRNTLTQRVVGKSRDDTRILEGSLGPGK